MNVSDNNHNQGASANATVTSAASCDYAAPTVTLSPANLSGAAGTKLVYTVTVVNNDSSTCNASTLMPSSSLPTGWTTAYSTTGLKLDPGASGNFTMTKTIPANAAVNTYPVSLNVSDNNHNQGASASATVTSSNASCSHAPPSVTVSPADQSGAPGGKLTYTVTVVNNDTSACAAATLAPSSALPSGWTHSFSTSGLKLAPGASGNFTMTKTIPANAAPNTYKVSVNVSDNKHNQGASAYATVTGSACTYSSPSVTISPASQSGAPGSKLNYSVTVVNKDTSSCPSATFAPSSALPSGWTTSYSTASLKLAPGASGNFTMTKTIPANAPANTYGVMVTLGDANHNQSATASATVTSSCVRAAPSLTISPGQPKRSPRHAAQLHHHRSQQGHRRLRRVHIRPQLHPPLRLDNLVLHLRTQHRPRRLSQLQHDQDHPRRRGRQHLRRECQRQRRQPQPGRLGQRHRHDRRLGPLGYPQLTQRRAGPG
ncbi:MAG: hypothetical protein IPJ98_27065 [Bryobacterales bacterium]|nr:hypothetical protein [Bryobacterales bacterium]